MNLREEMELVTERLELQSWPAPKKRFAPVCVTGASDPEQNRHPRLREDAASLWWHRGYGRKKAEDTHVSPEQGMKTGTMSICSQVGTPCSSVQNPPLSSSVAHFLTSPIHPLGCRIPASPIILFSKEFIKN
jgi:hypothetical protein